MSITDELREYMLCNPPAHYADFSAIVHRIDAEHERALSEQFETLTADMKPMTDENMAEGGWLKLPVDADGVPIRVGDVMEVKFEPKRKPFTVSFVGERAVAFWVDGQPDLKSFNLDNVLVIHHHEPTVEDVLREFAKCWDDPAHYAKGELVETFAEKLREVLRDE